MGKLAAPPKMSLCRKSNKSNFRPHFIHTISCAELLPLGEGDVLCPAPQTLFELYSHPAWLEAPTVGTINSLPPIGPSLLNRDYPPVSVPHNAVNEKRFYKQVYFVRLLRALPASWQHWLVGRKFLRSGSISWRRFGICMVTVTGFFFKFTIVLWWWEAVLKPK